jgi:hypothetical protein
LTKDNNNATETRFEESSLHFPVHASGDFSFCLCDIDICTMQSAAHWKQRIVRKHVLQALAVPLCWDFILSKANYVDLCHVSRNRGSDTREAHPCSQNKAKNVIHKVSCAVSYSSVPTTNVSICNNRHRHAPVVLMAVTALCFYFRAPFFQSGRYLVHFVNKTPCIPA